MGRRGLDMNAPVRGRDWIIGAFALAVAIAALVTGTEVGKIHSHATHSVVVAWVCAIVMLIAGIFAIRTLTASVGRFMTQRSYPAAGAIVRLVATGVGAIVLLFALFAVLGVSLGHLLIGAGVAGVIIGIAAQQSLANIFAALVLLFARPFIVGERIRIRSGTLGVLDVEVLGIGLTYVTVRTEDGILKVPNSAMLASGIGQFEGKPEQPPA
jgi:small-conductance mechanosensitive channel